MVDPRVTLTMADGIRIVVPDALHLITPYVLVEQQDWFEDELRFIRAALEPGQVAIDIGANYGVYTLSMAAVVGPTGAVYAFEPASRTASFLRESLTANHYPQVTLEQKALSSIAGRLPLALHENAELNALTSAAMPADAAVEWVEVVTLDDCVKQFGWSAVDFLKIDAEGEELKILKGAKNFLNAYSPLIQFEIRAGTEFNFDVVTELDTYGFRFYRLVPELNVLVPFDRGSPPDPFLLNLFAVKADTALQLQHRGRLVQLQAPTDDSIRDLMATQAAPRHQWPTALCQYPYARALQPTWEQTMGGREDDTLVRALSLYAISRDVAIALPERTHALAASVLLLDRVCVDSPGGLREASFARVALAYGARSAAVQRLLHRLAIIQQSQQIDLSEPFLAPLGRFEAVDPQGRVPTWVAAALLECVEIAGAYSSFYTNGENRQRLEYLVSLGYASPEITRRLQLVQARFPTR